jgi:acyl-CoA thioesterase I
VRDSTEVPQHPAPSTQSRRLLFVGTSLTAGLGLEADSAYPQRFARMVDSAGLPYDVINAGVSGETSAGLLRRLDWLLRGPVDVLVLETGANDGLRGIPVASMRENIRTALTRVRAAHPNAALYLVQMEAPPNLGRRYTDSFRQTYPEVAAETGATLLPFLLDDVAGKEELNQPDGIHPNAEGARIVAERLWNQLSPALRARAGAAESATAPAPIDRGAGVR